MKVSHSTTIRHSAQIRKAKKTDKWVLRELDDIAEAWTNGGSRRSCPKEIDRAHFQYVSRAVTKSGSYMIIENVWNVTR
ncbi:hypothetical protein WN48_04913 [Eufriesea mexicana]|uniref:Uncharacterized protein n=1 Tax=Eufriesea mexicana TaxID=516756 RepID=A0A310SKT5_9HYME|nr:hypothetical protein WN48_04913 [Eufriesea mexicana]